MSKIENVVARFLLILREIQKNGTCRYPVPKSDSWDVWQRGMKDDIVRLKPLLED